MKNDTKNKNALAVAMILIAASGWGVIGVFSRPMTAAGLSSFQVTLVRSVTVMVFMGALLLVKDRALFKVRLKDFWMFLGTGLISIVFFNVCYFSTIQMTTLATASILLYTAPCFVMLMSAVFFHERVTARKLAALALAFAGCVLVSGLTSGSITPRALLTGIGAGFGYATYSIFGKVALKKYHTFTVIFYTFVVSTACLLPFAGAGVVSTFMPYVFYTTGLESIEAGKASVLAFAEPMVATISGILVFHEKLNVMNAAGIGLIFIAIVLLNVPAGKGKGE